MGFNEFISKLFGNKATRDMKEIQPWVEKVKAVYPEISKLTNDELRAKTEGSPSTSIHLTPFCTPFGLWISI